MNPKYKASWVRALRSGKFRQGRGELYRCGKRCCLGVLCEISGVPRIGHTYGGEIHILSRRLLEEFDLSSDDVDRLVRLNDVGERSFRFIADWIEENL